MQYENDISNDDQVNNKKTYTKKEVYNYSTNNNKGKVNNQYSKTKPAKKSYNTQNNKKVPSYKYKPAKPAQKSNNYVSFHFLLLSIILLITFF